MCEKATSHLFNVNKREMVIHTIGSHTETRDALQINANDPCYIEVEWLETSPCPSIRFTEKQDADERQLIIDWYAKRFPERLDLFRHCVSKSCGNIDLGSLTALPEHLTLPKSCGNIYLGSLTTLPEHLTLPKSCGNIDLNSLTTLPEHLTLPTSCENIDLYSLTALPEHLTLPKSCGNIYLRSDLRAILLSRKK